MKGSVSWLSFALLSSLIAISAGCGGAGPSSGAGAAPAAVHEVTGVAATGAPIANGTVFLKDSSDTPVERQQSTRSDGSFTFDASGLKPPFILKIANNNQNLYSISTNFGITNITPLTAIVVAQAAQRDDLDALYTAYKPAELISIAQRMPEADMTVQNIFAPLMTSYNVTGSLVNGQFSANHTGYDALLDVISVSVVPGAITVTLKNNNTVLLNVAANQLGNAALATVLTPATPAPTPAIDGPTLYSSNCASCHGALASSNKAGATASSIQTAINNNTGSMGSLTGLTSVRIAAISAALATVTSSPTPAPAQSCGSCHAIPPATGRHSKHRRVGCVTCHGSGYSTTSFNAATHNNGVKNIDTAAGWNIAKRSCSNACHGSETW